MKEFQERGSRLFFSGRFSAGEIRRGRCALQRSTSNSGSGRPTRRLAGLAGRLVRITRPEETGKLARGRSRRLYTGSLDLIRLRPTPRSWRSYWFSGGSASQSLGSVSVSRRWLVEGESLTPPPFQRQLVGVHLFICCLSGRQIPLGVFLRPKRNNVLSYFVPFANRITKRRRRHARRESGAGGFCATAGRHGDQGTKRKLTRRTPLGREEKEECDNKGAA